MKISTSILLGCLLIISCSHNEMISDKTITVFDKQTISFSPDMETDALDNMVSLGSGRLVLKKIQLPKKNYYHHAQATIRLESTGDPWDKSGSFFILPGAELENLDHTNSVELLRFITPFGVGYFNDQEHIQKLKPSYIPRWEDDITWETDISHLLPILEGEVWLGLYIDTWSNEGWLVDVSLQFDEHFLRIQPPQKDIIPLLNTTPMFPGQTGYDKFASIPITKTFYLEQDYDDVQLYYLTTGHGGHSTGDEFTKRLNVISLNNNVVKEFIPWRDDCASFRRFNPSSGVWMTPAEWKGEIIEERIASSDYSRSGWCPGSDVPPVIVELGPLKKGQHSITFSIPSAQETTKEFFNFWNVSAYIIFD